MDNPSAIARSSSMIKSLFKAYSPLKFYINIVYHPYIRPLTQCIKLHCGHVCNREQKADINQGKLQISIQSECESDDRLFQIPNCYIPFCIIVTTNENSPSSENILIYIISYRCPFIKCSIRIRLRK